MEIQHRIGLGRRTLTGVLLAGSLVLLAACGGTAARPAPSPTSSPVSAYRALVVTMVDTPDVQTHNVFNLYDSSSGLTRQVTGLPGMYGKLRFAPGDRLSVSNYAQILSVDLNGGSGRPEAAVPDNAPLAMGDYAWSRSGALAYLLIGPNDRAGDSQLVVRPASGTTVQVPFGHVPGGATSSVRFSLDGTKLLIDGAGVQVRGLDGALLFIAANGAGATWGTDGRVYFWDPRGVNVADPATGATRTILPATHWYNPDTSPDGKRIAYEVRDAQGGAELRLLDTSTMKVDADFARVGGYDPRFVSSGELWYHGQASKDPSMTPLVSYDLVHGSERSTGLTGVLNDVRQVASA